MNQDRFMDLLNLYVDHEISAVEACELEGEIQANPARRRVYEQYCRMQRASAVLFENTRSLAPASPALARALEKANRKVAAGAPAAGSLWSSGTGLATFAAAACFAVVFVRYGQPPELAPSSLAVAPAAETSVAVSPATGVQTLSAKAFALDYDSHPSAYAQTEKAADYLSWTDQVQFRPITKVHSQSVVLAPSGSVQPAVDEASVAPKATQEPTQEMTAVQFKH